MEIVKSEDLIAILGKNLAICISSDFEEAIISPNSKTIKKDMKDLEIIELFELLLNDKIDTLKDVIKKEIITNLKKQHYCKLKEKKEFLKEINDFFEFNIVIDWSKNENI